jgi:5'-3' exonuclease
MSQHNSVSKGRNNHLRDFLEMICMASQAGLQLIFVFDGNTRHAAKVDTLEERKAAVKRQAGRILELSRRTLTTVAMHADEGQADEDVSNEDVSRIGYDALKSVKDQAVRDELSGLLRNFIVIGRECRDDLVRLFKLVRTPYIRARGEADFICHNLYAGRHIDGVFSEDTDMLTHGVGRLIRGIFSNEARRDGIVTEYNLADLLDGCGLSMTQFIDFCILCGCDYCPKIDKVAARRGLMLIKTHGNLGAVADFISAGGMTGVTLPAEYREKAERAHRIFTGEGVDEPLPDWIGKEVETMQAPPELREWILASCNYTAATLDKRLASIGQESVCKTPVRIKVNVRKCGVATGKGCGVAPPLDATGKGCGVAPPLDATGKGCGVAPPLDATGKGSGVA